MSIYGVIKFQAPFERLKEYDYSPEVRLHKAILTQAMIDASNTTDAKDAKKLELEAKTWVFSNSEYFQEVCSIAGIEPGFMIKITKEAIQLNSTKKISCQPRSNNKERNVDLDIRLERQKYMI